MTVIRARLAPNSSRFCLCQQPLADPVGLQPRLHGEHAEVKPVRLSAHEHAAEYRLATGGEQQTGIVIREDVGNLVGIGALATQQIGLGRPPHPARLASVSAFDQGHDCVTVPCCGIAKLDLVGRFARV
jgi:hypothetical protein